jgi:alpha-D-xyloside xylohydrolase
LTTRDPEMSRLLSVIQIAALLTLAWGSAGKKGNFQADSRGTCAVSDSAKVDCGYAGIDQGACESKGCCWSPAGQNSATPWCFNAGQASSGYSLSGFKETSNGYAGTLTLIGDGTSAYGADIKQLSLQVVFETDSIARVKITDAKNARYEVPQSVITRTDSINKISNNNIKFSFTESPFSFEIIRVSDGQSLFKLGDSFTFKDQYLEIPTSIDTTAKTYGLGESTRLSQALTTGTYTLWALDQAAISFNHNLYGSYPYYLQLIKGLAHGVMLMNSNGMDVVLQSNSLTFKANGGIVDLYFFAGSSPAEVVSQYTSIIGRPMMMPYWSLGFHNCKYGYTSVYQVEEVVANYSAAGIPLDTQWMDIDYMQAYKDFTTDATNFPVTEVKSFVDNLHAKGQHFVPIVDPGIFVQSGYDAYEQGIAQDVFIKDMTGGYYLGQVWPGPTYFPDFLHPNTQSYWTKQLQSFHNSVPVDGIWIDMNEVSNFCNVDGKGQVCSNTASQGCPAAGASQTDCCLVCSTVDSSNKYDFPPYQIGNSYGNLATKTIAASATQYGNHTVYNTHNLYGLTEQIATNTAMTTIRAKRPFILSRSSFLSTGKHSAKWTGDNGATWNDLKSSIISVMDFNLFGVPMIGADICGFLFDTTEELCARWIEVGAFYPFTRNHNAIGQIPQEFYLWTNVANAAKNALNIRYQLLPVLYTLFYQAQMTGATVARSLWFNNPADTKTIGIDGQFMWGNAVMISPVLEQGSTSVNAYFPQGLWYTFNVDSADRTLSVDASTTGVYKTLSTPLTSVNVHVKGGNILPLTGTAMTTTAARQTGFTLLVALCPGGKAYGQLFWDDGEQVTIDQYVLVNYEAAVSNGNGNVSGTVAYNTYMAAKDYKIKAVQVLGTSSQLKQPVSATVNGKAMMLTGVSFDSARSSLMFSGLDLSLSEALSLTWSA